MKLITLVHALPNCIHTVSLNHLKCLNITGFERPTPVISIQQGNSMGGQALEFFIYIYIL